MADRRASTTSMESTASRPVVHDVLIGLLSRSPPFGSTCGGLPGALAASHFQECAVKHSIFRSEAK
jgi:hypothetical protein